MSRGAPHIFAWIGRGEREALPDGLLVLIRTHWLQKLWSPPLSRRKSTIYEEAGMGFALLVCSWRQEEGTDMSSSYTHT